jgi:purine-binding chemotaxis protein CheW
MDKLNHLVVFSLDDQRFAVPLSAVVRTERMVALTPLPKAPDIVTGIINFHGQVIPVVDIRSRFNMTPRPSELSDQLLILQTGERTIAFTVDFVEGVIDGFRDQCVDAGSVLPIMEYVKGVVKLEDGMVLIHDPDAFLALEEGRTLDEVMKERKTETEVHGRGKIG